MAEKLGRFLIEPREQTSIVYNQYLDKPAVEIRIKLNSFLEIDYPTDFHLKMDKMKSVLFAVSYFCFYIGVEG